jgi:hypothetical protein
MKPAKTFRFVAAAVVVAFACIGGLLQAGEPSWKSEGIIHVTRSPYAKLHSVPVRAVQLGEGFWASRMRVNAERSIPTLLDLLEEHGVVDNFRRVSGRKKGARRGPLFTDSDLYKWIEAAAFVLQSEENTKLRATIDNLVDEIVAAQEPSGYLNTYYVDERRDRRFTEQQRGHELYCLGHLLQGAIAYYRATGERKLLDVGIRYVNYLVENFGPDKRPALTGHPELEMALVELYRTTGDRRDLEFAGYLLRGEGERLKLTAPELVYLFSGQPFTSRTKLEGHAVRALYATSGGADYYLETGEEAYRRTLERLWRDMVQAKMYITGGVGSRALGEAFGEPYELPNAQAYTESCAAIANLMWNWRMLAATGEARFTDVLERALYNGINSGMSLDGTLYCYRNPLESAGEKMRNPWYDTTCCPPNLQRTFAALPGYFYSTSPEGVYVHLYHHSTLQWHLEDGTPLIVTQTSKYPWEAEVTLTVSPGAPVTFTLFLRIPAWSRTCAATVNGKPTSGAAQPGQYLPIRRAWRAGDKVRLAFDMTPRVIVSNPRLRENTGRVAVERGPLVYCLEQADHPELDSIFDVRLPLGPEPGKEFTVQYRPDLLGGVIVLGHKGIATAKSLTEEPLYQVLERGYPGGQRAVRLTLIPYYAWANRETGAMQVWIPYTRTASQGETRR